MQLDTASLPRARALELSPRTFRRLALASAISLYAIVVSGAVVRLTASGLGCESWPGCEAGSFFPASDHHAFVEFGNRAVSIFPILLSLATAIGAWFVRGLPRSAAVLAVVTAAGTLAQAPLGLVTILSDLHPLLVMSHFLLALVVLGTAVVVALVARGSRADAEAPRPLRRAGLVLAGACAILVVTGTFATAAGPHSGGADIRRFGNLVDAVELHVRTTAVFGVTFVLLLAYLAVRRARFPRLFKLGLLLLGLLLAQMAVGEIQWRSELPWGVVLVHVALAAAIWVVTVVLATLLWRAPESPPERLDASA